MWSNLLPAFDSLHHLPVGGGRGLSWVGDGGLPFSHVLPDAVSLDNLGCYHPPSFAIGFGFIYQGDNFRGSYFRPVRHFHRIGVFVNGMDLGVVFRSSGQYLFGA
jgi:hypothetical protein